MKVIPGGIPPFGGWLSGVKNLCCGILFQSNEFWLGRDGLIGAGGILGRSQVFAKR